MRRIAPSILLVVLFAACGSPPPESSGPGIPASTTVELQPSATVARTQVDPTVGYLLVDGAFRLTELQKDLSLGQICCDRLTSVLNRADGTSIWITQSPETGLGKFIEAIPFEAVGRQSTRIFLNYENGSQSVIVSGAGAKDALQLASSASTQLSSGTPIAEMRSEGFEPVDNAFEKKRQPIQGTSSVYEGDGQWLRLRVTPLDSIDERVEFLTAGDEIVQTSDRRYVVSTTTGDGSIVISFVENGYLVEGNASGPRASAGGVDGVVALFSSVKGVGGAEWDRSISELSQGFLQSQLLSSAENAGYIYELRQDSDRAAICQRKDDSAVCGGSSDLAVFSTDNGWAIVGTSMDPTFAVAADGKEIELRCGVDLRCWYFISSATLTGSVHVAMTSTSPGFDPLKPEERITNQIGDADILSP